MKKNLLKLGSALGSMALAMSLTSTRVMANAFDGITGKPSGNDVFGGVTSVTKDVGNSAINLFTVGGAVLVVIGLILCGMALVFFKGDQEVAKNKKYLIAVVGGAVLIFGAIGIGRGIANVGGSVGDSFTNNSGKDSTESGFNYEQADGIQLASVGEPYGLVLTVGDEVA